MPGSPVRPTSKARGSRATSPRSACKCWGELITILPFLALLWYLHAKVGLSRNAAVLAAWLLSAIAFGLLHLPTYDWNVVQCLVVIAARGWCLTWAYVWTKNIWVSTGAHIINDFTLISMTVFVAPLAAAA